MCVCVHAPPPHTYYLHHTHSVSLSLPPPPFSPSLSSPPSPLRALSLSLSCLYTYSHSARREHMYLRNVKPLKFAVKAATPPTASPKGFQEHMFLTYVSSEALMQWEGAGSNMGAQVPSESLLLISQGKGMEVVCFFFLFFSSTLSLPPSLLSILPLIYPKGFTWFLLKNHVIVTKL